MEFLKEIFCYYTNTIPKNENIIVNDNFIDKSFNELDPYEQKILDRSYNLCPECNKLNTHVNWCKECNSKKNFVIGLVEMNV